MSGLKLLKSLAFLVICGFMCSCVVYGQPVVDDNYHLVYIPWTKAAFGGATDSGVLTCVPRDDGLACVSRINEVNFLPPLGYCSAPSCKKPDSPAGSTQMSYAESPRAGSQRNAGANTADDAALLDNLKGFGHVEPSVDCSQVTKNVKRIDIVNDAAPDKATMDLLQCWQGKTVVVFGKNDSRDQGKLFKADFSNFPTISLYTLSGMKYLSLSSIRRIELP